MYVAPGQHGTCDRKKQGKANAHIQSRTVNCGEKNTELHWMKFEPVHSCAPVCHHYLPLYQLSHQDRSATGRVESKANSYNLINMQSFIHVHVIVTLSTNNTACCTLYIYVHICTINVCKSK